MEKKSFICHLHPGISLFTKFLIDRGKLAPDGVIADHLPDGLPQPHLIWINIQKHLLHGVLALVACHTATSARFQNFDSNVNIQL